MGMRRPRRFEPRFRLEVLLSAETLPFRRRKMAQCASILQLFQRAGGIREVPAAGWRLKLAGVNGGDMDEFITSLSYTAIERN
jgi:hypothetical protein